MLFEKCCSKQTNKTPMNLRAQKHHIEQKKTVETPCCQKFQFVLPDFTKETKKKQACLPITDLSNRPTIIKIAPPFTYVWFKLFIFRIDGENFVFCDPKFKYGENHPDLFVNLPPKFNSSPLKNGGWKMPIYFLGRPNLMAAMLNFRSVPNFFVFLYTPQVEDGTQNMIRNLREEFFFSPKKTPKTKNIQLEKMAPWNRGFRTWKPSCGCF